jgi:hypothetical protein
VRIGVPARRRAARACGGTPDDGVLTHVGTGIHDPLAARRERPRRPWVAMCPMSRRTADDLEATLEVATPFARPGPPRAGVARRMGAIVAGTAAALREMPELSNAAAQGDGVLAFGLSFAAQAPGLGAAAPCVVNLVISNVGAVPGQRCLGRSRGVGTCPISMIAEPPGLNVTPPSCDGPVDIGLLAHRAAGPEPDAMARRGGEAFERLRQAARRGKRPNAAQSPADSTAWR